MRHGGYKGKSRLALPGGTRKVGTGGHRKSATRVALPGSHRKIKRGGAPTRKISVSGRSLMPKKYRVPWGPGRSGARGGY